MRRFPMRIPLKGEVNSMKRVSTSLAFLFLLFLASCGAAGTNTAVSPVSPESGGNEDTAVSVTLFTPAQNVEGAARLRSDDHTHGAAEPIVAIIEYGDFQ